MIFESFHKLLLSPLFLMIISIEAYARPQIIFAPEIEISQKGKTYLADVVSLRNGQSDLILALEKIVFFENNDKFEKPLEFTSLELSRKLKEISKNQEIITKANPIFILPTTIKFTPSKDGLISMEEVSNRLKLRFSLECPTCKFKFSTANKINPNGKDWEIDYSNLHIKSNLLLPVVGNDYKSFRWFNVQVKIWDLVPIAINDLVYGKFLKADDFRLEEREISSISNRFSNMDLIAQQKMIQPVRSGEIITPQMTKKDPLIRKGDTVKGYLGNDQFEIHLQFISEGDGFKGDTITVKSIATGKKLTAIVLDRNLVKLQE